MSNTQLKHTDFREIDIIKDGIVNEDNLDQLCKQINDLSSYDKVGSSFYEIDKEMKFSDFNREPEFVLQWLRHLETLPVTSQNVGYLGRNDQ